jgi:hypothetical protein
MLPFNLWLSIYFYLFRVPLFAPKQRLSLRAIMLQQFAAEQESSMAI